MRSSRWDAFFLYSCFPLYKYVCISDLAFSGLPCVDENSRGEQMRQWIFIARPFESLNSFFGEFPLLCQHQVEKQARLGARPIQI
jgi:hypothetical protein